MVLRGKLWLTNILNGHTLNHKNSMQTPSGACIKSYACLAVPITGTGVGTWPMITLWPGAGSSRRERVMKKLIKTAGLMALFLAAAAALYIGWLLLTWPDQDDYNVIIKGRAEAPILEMAAEEDLHGR